MISILESIADIILVALLGFVVAVFASLRNRRPLFRFFGLTQANPNLMIYLSRLEILPKGTMGIEAIYAGYSGPAINIHEYVAALKLKGLFNSRLISIFPLKDRLGGAFFTLTDVQPAIKETPEKDRYNDIQFTNMIIIGSSIYNLAAEHYSKKKTMSVYYFDKNIQGERVIKARRGKYKDQEVPPPPDRDLGIIERIIDQGRVVYLCAGNELNVTCSTVQFVVDNWRMLHRTFGDGDNFAICLSFRKAKPNTGTIIEADEELIDFYPPKAIWR